MADPNQTLDTIKLLCDDVAKSKTRLGYDSDLMRRVGTYVFGSWDAVRDAVQAPDGQSWRSMAFAEAERRGKAEADRDALQEAIDAARVALLNIEGRSEKGRAEISRLLQQADR